MEDEKTELANELTMAKWVGLDIYALNRKHPREEVLEPLWKDGDLIQQKGGSKIRRIVAVHAENAHCSKDITYDYVPLIRVFVRGKEEE